jgi:hypothetical protein
MGKGTLIIGITLTVIISAGFLIKKTVVTYKSPSLIDTWITNHPESLTADGSGHSVPFWITLF